MNTLRRPSAETALTLIDVLVVVVVLVVLAGMLMPRRPGRPARGKRITCVNHLKQAGLALRTYAVDFGGRYPWDDSTTNRGPVPANDDARQTWRYFAIVATNLPSPKVLWCPADVSRTPADCWTNNPAAPKARVFGSNRQVSYFIGLTATEENPQIILSGDRNITNALPFVPANFGKRISVGYNTHLKDIGPNNRIGYDGRLHNQAGNLLLGDGSVQQVTSGRLKEALQDAAKSIGEKDQEFLFPYGED